MRPPSRSVAQRGPRRRNSNSNFSRCHISAMIAKNHFCRVTFLMADSLAHYQAGLAYRRAGRLPEAVQAFIAALSIDETHSDAVLELSAVLDLQGQTRQSLQLLSNAAQI